MKSFGSSCDFGVSSLPAMRRAALLGGWAPQQHLPAAAAGGGRKSSSWATIGNGFDSPAASEQPGADSQAVVAFLRECGLQEYSTVLLESGFDDMESLCELSDADMQEVNMHPLHAAHLRRSLQQLQSADCVDQGLDDRGIAVVEFLEEQGLGQYVSVLLASGFDEMETLCEIEDADMRDLGIPRGHALKLRRHLREQHLPAPVDSPPTAVAVAPRHELHATDAMRCAVRRSWEKIQELGTIVVGEYVYKAFFEIVPEAVGCFPLHVRMRYREWAADAGEEEEEGDLAKSPALARLFGKVLNAIGCCVAGLQDPAQLVPLLSSLGARHISYGVDYHFWPALGQALNKTLWDILGDSFTPEVENAWNIVYGFMSSIMIESLKQARDAAAKQTRAYESECVESPCASSSGEEEAAEEKGADDVESPLCSNPQTFLADVMGKDAGQQLVERQAEEEVEETKLENEVLVHEEHHDGDKERISEAGAVDEMDDMEESSDCEGDSDGLWVDSDCEIEENFERSLFHDAVGCHKGISFTPSGVSPLPDLMLTARFSRSITEESYATCIDPECDLWRLQEVA